MIEGIRKFYIDTIASTEIAFSSGIKKVNPITRLEFYAGSAIATAFLVQKIALSLFFLFTTLLTCFQSQSSKESLYHNTQEAQIFLGAVFVGNLGCFIPETTNDYFLRIPVEGLVIPLA